MPVRKKTQKDTAEVQSASMMLLEGSGERGAKPRPFSHEAAVRRFQGWIYSAASINARAVASVPLRLYVKKRAGQKCLWQTRKASRARMAYLKGDAKQTPDSTVYTKAQSMGDMEEVVESHPLIELLNSFNPWLNSFDACVLRMLCLELTGNFYILKVQEDGPQLPPTQLWPMMPQWTEIIPDRQRWVSGYLYGRDPMNRRVFDAADVIHFRYPNPRDLFYGLGKVEAGWAAVSLDESNHLMDLATADNMGRPDYLVVVKSAQNDALDRLDSKIKTQLRGKSKAGKWLSVSGEIDLKPLQWPPKDLAGREDVVEEIAAVFGVPVSMLKANDPNLASAKAGYQTWRESTILPMCRMDEQSLNQSLVPMYDEDLLLAYDNPVPSDEVAELNETREYVNIGLVSRNERRAELGYAAVDDPMADKLLVNGIPLGGAAPAMQFNLNQTDAPKGEPAAEAPAAGGEQEIQTVEAAVLNGAQISSAKDIVLAVVAGQLPRDSGVSMLEAFFNLTRDKAEKIMGSAGTPKPTTPNPVPATEATNGDDSNRGDDPAGAAGNAGRGVGGDDDDGQGKDAAATGAGQKSEAAEGAHGIDISMRAMFNGEHSACCLHEKAGSDEPRDMEREGPILAFAARMADIFARQRESLADAMMRMPGQKAAKESAPMQGLMDTIDLFNAEMNEAVRAALDPFMQAGGDAGQAKIREAVAKKPRKPESKKPNFDPFNVRDENVSKALDKYAVKLTQEIQGYTGRAISQTIKGEMETGGTIADISRKLREDASYAGGVLSPARSEVIARTESARGYTAGQEESWKQSGVVEGKRWELAAGACPFCEAAAAKFNSKTTPLGQAFFAKGSTLTATVDGKQRTMVMDYSDVQGPPLHPNDRCGIEAVLIGE